MAIRHFKKLAKNIVTATVNASLKLIAPKIPYLTADEWAESRISFSQFGEDRIIESLRGEITTPSHRIYVDVGAYHPTDFSNTLLLHKAGWRGVNIDANHRSITKFDRSRPSDLNICEAVSDDVREVDYCEYGANATNRIVPNDETCKLSVLGEPPRATTTLTTKSLNAILSTTIPQVDRIGFLNIDCEGQDMRLLRHFDFQRWRPYIVAAEAHDLATETEMISLMNKANYSLAAKTFVTLIFRASELLTKN